jgi:hypothetical protein
MKDESNEPQPPRTSPRPCATPHSAPVGWLRSQVEADPPGADAPDTPGDPAAAIEALPARVTRHDGWSGEKMAAFCEALAETAVVAEACDAARMGISGAYAARRRNPFFAAAWDAALTIARERLADTLLARSMEGNVEQIYKDGELVGERHVLDNRLGLAILRRLDRLAETGMTISTRGERLPFPDAGRGPGQRGTAAAQRPGPGPRRGAFDWELAIDGLRTGNDAAVAQALALLKSDEVEEVDASPVSLIEDDEGLDLSDRCWWEEIDEMWLTDFPPPPAFSGYESRPYDEIDDEEPYVRACTAEEVELLEADAAAIRADERAEEEALRDAWFELLRAESSAHEHGQHGVLSERSADAERRLSSSKSRAEPASGSPSGEPD